MVPESFASLPEYADDALECTRSTDMPDSVISANYSPARGVNAESIIDDQSNVVILKTFEDVTRRSSSSGKHSRISPTSEISDPFCALSLSPDPLPSPLILEDDILPYMDPHLEQRKQDSALFAHFRHVVWKQLFPHNRALDDSYGLDSGMTLSVNFLECEAAHFPAVRPINIAPQSRCTH